MRNTKIITGNAYLTDQKKQNFFSKEELNLILSLYGKGVSSGQWKDYAIDSSKDETIFSIYRHASEMPLFKITKNHNSKRVDERWLIKSTSGQILKRNKNLIYLLNFFKKNKLKIKLVPVKFKVSTKSTIKIFSLKNFKIIYEFYKILNKNIS